MRGEIVFVFVFVFALVLASVSKASILVGFIADRYCWAIFFLKSSSTIFNAFNAIRGSM